MRIMEITDRYYLIEFINLFDKIKLDDTFWNEKMVTRLTTFHMDFLLKQLIKDELK